MRNGVKHILGVGILAGGAGLLVPDLALAQKTQATASVVCESKVGERNVCPADTSGGVALAKSTGPTVCLLGKNWGYDDAGVWVCGRLQRRVPARPVRYRQARLAPGTGQSSPVKEREPMETWGEFDPGKGFLVGKSELGVALDQRLRAGAIREPDARRADLHRSPRERAHRRWPQRHLAAPASWSSSRGGSAARSWSTRSPSGPCSTPTRTPSSATSATSSAGSSASTPASTGTRDRARSRARIPSGSATTA